MKLSKRRFSVLLTAICVCTLMYSCAANKQIAELDEDWWNVPVDTTAAESVEIVWPLDPDITASPSAEAIAPPSTQTAAPTDAPPPSTQVAAPADAPAPAPTQIAAPTDTAPPPSAQAAAPAVAPAPLPTQVATPAVAPAPPPTQVATPADASAPAPTQIAAPTDTATPPSAQAAAPVAAPAPAPTQAVAPTDTPAQPSTQTATPPPPRRTFPTVTDSAKAVFENRFVKAGRDSLIAIIRNDYAICVGSTAGISNDRLLTWKASIDSAVMNARYPEIFRAYVAATGVKAHDVRPCEPIAFAERREREQRVMDSTLAAQRIVREKARRDSAALDEELKTLKSNPADILNVPAGISKTALQTMLARNKINAKTVDRHLQANKVKFKNLTVTVAFYFDNNDKYIGYEVETEAAGADQIDKTVRGWATQLAAVYEETLGPPNTVTRVSFQDIRQGRMSITSSWNKDAARPRVLVGLATHNHQYYAKAMVSY